MKMETGRGGRGGGRGKGRGRGGRRGNGRGRGGGSFGRKAMYGNNSRMQKQTEEKDMDEIRNACENIAPENVKFFKDLPLSKKTLLGLKESGYTEPTEIQRESLCLSLRGLDVLGAAQTGSGKTLAFILPIIELLYHNKWVNENGIGALVITPTRELAYQIFETLRKVGCHHNFSAGLIIGGKDLHFEKNRMDSCNIVICTPGRLLQHMDENPLFTCDNMQILVLDEADRCLDMGFEQAMNCIIENLPPNRQTLLFSATQTKSVRDLARLSLKDPMYVSVHEHAKHSTPKGLQQSYMVCKLHEKIDVLWSFIKNHRKQKILVFLSSCKQVKYHYDMFCRLRPNVTLLALYGTLHQLRRMSIYEEFCRKLNVVLFATDIAARGLDFPEVNWVLQMDCPEDANTYIHRAGRTARYHRGGESLLVLLPSEEDGMLKQLKAKKIPINKIRVNPKKLQSPLRQMESLLAQNTELKATAQRAFVSYLKAVYFMKNKEVFNIHALDLNAYSRSIGLAIPPKVRFLKKTQKLLQQKTLKNDVDAVALMCSKITENDEFSIENQHSGTEVDERDNVAAGRSHQQAETLNQDDSESDDADNFLQLKRKDHDLDVELKSISIEEQPISQKNKKIKTKIAVAKTILRKKIVSNKKTVFDDEGQAIVNHMQEKVSDVAREYENEDVGGIDIEKARQILKEEDKYDKQLFRQKMKEKRRERKFKLKKSRTRNEDEEGEEEEEEEGDKEKEQEQESEEYSEDGSDSDSGPDLSWLPDPDKIYGPKTECSNSSGNSSSEEENSTPEEEISSLKEGDSDDYKERLQPADKRKRRNTFTSKEVKRRKVQEHSDSQINLSADEELALHFLKSK